jgi:hypothetical protein
MVQFSLGAGGGKKINEKEKANNKQNFFSFSKILATVCIFHGVFC